MENAQKHPSPAVREAVGVFDDIGAIHDCVDELQSQGFDRSDITMLARDQVVGSKSLLPIEDTLQTEDSPSALRGPVIEPESVGDAKGALLGAPIYILTLACAGVSAAFGLSTVMLLIVSAIGGLMGAGIGLILMNIVDKRQTGYYDRQLEHGGIPLWIHTRDPDHEQRAIDILMHNRARDVHIHDLDGLPYEVQDGRTTVYKIIH
ncbi:hypothetical protein [Sneathiella sp.]|jgi:hypothetical protein|uniref:hypothetical protein n=1 Tax=Sneathiella sp. TaxID=1964365 RepID=UPI0039E3276A